MAGLVAKWMYGTYNRHIRRAFWVIVGERRSYGNLVYLIDKM
jgi:hypothetical protein